MDLETFNRMRAEDKMATEKLAEGIEGFSKALVALEELLAARLESTGLGLGAIAKTVGILKNSVRRILKKWARDFKQSAHKAQQEMICEAREAVFREILRQMAQIWPPLVTKFRGHQSQRLTMITEIGVPQAYH